MALYETVIIARPDMAAEDVDNLTTKLEKVITDGKGKVLSKEYWGLRKTAYRINKNDRAHYVMLSIEAKYPAIAELNRVLGINEDVMRSATINNEHNITEKTPLFACKNAKDFKPAKKKEDGKKDKKPAGKYDSIADQMQFDN